MPHITVDYSPRLADSLDLRVFAAELQPAVLEGSGSAGTCKMLFRQAAGARVADRQGDAAAFVHVEVGLLPGRPDTVRAQLSEDVLALLEKHLGVGATPPVVCSVEVRELDGSYRLRTF
ncbi:5-carboxymethyl-2-hydroxymuconate Delta-isomerase [Streptomyces sp. 900105755]|uniref:5-carboxymethyl-2-hydroxymuconate Delta-isomerase n=1 Tax=Streptomyces sp. Ag109_O5-10 TaxID=1855349 RepID=UPI0008969238|nr:5-carboxymethyl-2-hydroxymuconate delta isomerase [Streptomyces sp. Ag109_O5-10]SED82869.1 5-carboxymethyl-2-hydroxymuconate isomerase [Streptomyces sp. Ag109_O5-10]